MNRHIHSKLSDTPIRYIELQRSYEAMAEPYMRFLMNTVDFTSKYYIDRRGSHSRKWDGEHLKIQPY